MELVPKPTELSTATLALFQSIVKRRDDENDQDESNRLSRKFEIFPQVLTNKKIFYPSKTSYFQNSLKYFFNE